MFSLQSWKAITSLVTRAFAWLALVATLQARASVPMHFERLGVDAGLSQQAVLSIAQDSEGFLWFGTEDGLNRFDGYTFKHQTRDPGGLHDLDALPDDFITDVQLDAAGRLWVGTDGGVVWRDVHGKEFQPLPPDVPESLKRGLEHVRAMRFDHTGLLWIGSREAGLASFNPRDHHVTRFRHAVADSTSLSSDSIYVVHEDGHSTLWVGTQTGLDRLENGRFEHIASVTGPVRALAEDRGGVLWVATDAGLAQLTIATGKLTVFHHDPAAPRSIPSDHVLSLHVDGEERLWVGTAAGLALFDRVSRSFATYHSDPADPYSLPDDHILTLQEDRAGLLWIGTRFGGLARWNPRTWSFGQHSAGPEEGLANRNIMAFTEDLAGRLWIGTFGGGLAILDPHDSHANSLHLAGDDRVMALLTDHEGAVWAGTMDGALNRVDPQTFAVTAFKALGAPGVMSLLEDSSGRLWVGTFGGGLVQFERATGNIQRYTSNPSDPGTLSANRVTALAQDRTGMIWVGTDGGGLNLFDPVSGRADRLEHDPRKPRSLSSSAVYAIHQDPEGTVWIGTRAGLDRLVGAAAAPEAIRFDHFNARAGFPNNTIYGIHDDRAGRLWLSTNYGLVRFDPRSTEVRAFHRVNGLQEEEFNFGAHYQSRSGRLFFGGAKGYNAFDPLHVAFDDAPPPVVLTSLSQSGKPVTASPPFAMPHLHYRDVISFEFAALDFSQPRSNSFAFKLEGFDSDWEHAGARNRVTYTNLPQGHYTLHVRAANPDGIWNEAGLELPFDVEAPVWFSYWAYFSYALILAAIMGLCWMGHLRSLQREARYSLRLKEEVRARTRELAARNTELEVVIGRLEQASLTDPLTRLGNRRSLIKEMPGLVEQVDASQNTANPRRLSLMLIDLDRLKPINDQHGHEAGDLALEGVSNVLRRCLREEDRVVRWGGDEFVIVRAHSHLEDAARLAEEIRLKTAELRFRISDSIAAHTTCSIGFACYPFVLEAPQWATWQEVLNLADMALYRAKVRRDAWVGWCGLPRAARQTELIRLMSVDPNSAFRAGYIDVRTSRVRDGGDDGEYNERGDPPFEPPVEIPTRRLRTLAGP